MKKIFKMFLLILLMVLFFSNQYLNVKEYSNGYIKIKYKLQNYSTMAANQMAIWIKDIKGNYITTVYATKFMAAKGGYKKRKDCCPTWVFESNWSKASKKEVDAVSAATQKSGIQEVIWDCMDSNGKKVVPGTYIYQIEANLYYDERILLTGIIKIGNSQNSSKPELKEIHTKQDKNKKKVEKLVNKHGKMIENVEVTYYPK